MSDIERRLRDALHATAEQAPDGLLEAVMRRHRLRRWRLGAGLVAACSAVAVVLPPAVTALHSGAPAGRTPQRVTATRAARPPVAAAGTKLVGCGNANLGSIGAHWRYPGMTRAGHMWFLNGGHGPVPRAHRPPGQSLSLYVAIVVLDGHLKPGSVAVLRVAPAGRPYLRFLYALPNDSLNAGTHYSMRSGESGVTFVACPVPPGITNYYGGYLVRGVRCVPVRAWMPGLARPVRFHLGACGRPRT